MHIEFLENYREWGGGGRIKKNLIDISCFRYVFVNTNDTS